MFSVVILSRNAENVESCVGSIRACGESCRIIVVDDGLDWHRDDCIYVKGVKPFIFARNANIGIKLAREDVVLMNDDARLKTVLGFTDMVTKRHPRYGLVSATITENVGNWSQLPRKSGGMREEKRVVAFVCVLIPWQVYEHVGALCEKFVAYGCEDNDYCKRVMEAGLKIGIWDPCVIGHDGRSTFRSMENISQMLVEGRKIFKRIHGHRP